MVFKDRFAFPHERHFREPVRRTLSTIINHGESQAIILFKQKKNCFGHSLGGNDFLLLPWKSFYPSRPADASTRPRYFVCWVRFFCFFSRGYLQAMAFFPSGLGSREKRWGSLVTVFFTMRGSSRGQYYYCNTLPAHAPPLPDRCRFEQPPLRGSSPGPSKTSPCTRASSPRPLSLGAPPTTKNPTECTETKV